MAMVFQWFFNGFPNFEYDGHQWFRSWNKGKIIAVHTFVSPTVHMFRLFWHIDYITTTTTI